MLLSQASKVTELESYGWMLNDPNLDKERLLNGLPVTMRNLRRELATVYYDGSVRPVEKQFTLCRQEDVDSRGELKSKSRSAINAHLHNIILSVFGGLSNYRIK